MNGIRRDDYFTSYVVFDLETTGLSRKDEIIEIGAIKVVDGNEVSSFAELVKPEYPIPPFATIISGITNEMVADARKITDVLADFLMFIDGFVLVGHNIASFDIPFIKRVAKEKLSVEIEHDYVDTRYYAQYRVAGLENYQLGTI
jgi:DNA polymerase III epsilon subunit family exonuclease